MAREMGPRFRGGDGYGTAHLSHLAFPPPLRYARAFRARVIPGGLAGSN